MFTGIIEEIGTIKAIRKGSAAIQLTVSSHRINEDLKIGDSINTNGVCLTVTAFTDSSFEVDVMPETMTRTGFSQMKAGTKVNLERAVRLSDRLGGHLVSGHIDGSARILDTWKDSNAIWYRFATDPGILRYIVEKGSVAVDGISLTVASVDKSSFGVSVIPHTQSQTNLTGLKRGDIVNVECDLIGKYVEKLLKPGSASRIDIEFLAKNDFI